MFQIEKNIPVPVNCRGRKSLYPFPLMEPGDSFFVSGGKKSSVARCAYSWAARNGGKFSTSMMDGGVRVWRLA